MELIRTTKKRICISVMTAAMCFSSVSQMSMAEELSEGLSPNTWLQPKSFYDFGQGGSSNHDNKNNTFGMSLKTPNQPSVIAQSINFTDQYQNRAIAEWSLQKINGSMRQINDPWVQDTLSQLTAEINVQARQQSLYAVPVIASSAINAFAIPGGVIGINAGTVMSANSMDEVASVLAHEVAHLSQRHYEHGKDNQTKTLLIQAAGVLAAAVAASANEGNTATAILAGTSSVSRDSAMAFSRENEREADRMGMQIMAQAGYDVQGMPKFFSILNAMSQMNRSQYAFIPSYVRTHPMSDERMSEATTRASQYPKASLQTRKLHQRRYDLLRWRLKVLTKTTTESELKSASRYSHGATLALAQWYIEKQRFMEAKQTLNQLKSVLKHQNDLANSNEIQQLLAIIEAEIISNDVQHHSVSLNQKDKAVAILEGIQKVYPERRDLKLYLANALIETNDEQEAQRALTVLQPMSVKYANDRQVWQAMQLSNEVIARQSTDTKLAKIATINALRYRGQDQLWNASYEKALTSLSRAKEEANKIQNHALSSMIDAEIATIKKFKDFEV